MRTVHRDSAKYSSNYGIGKLKCSLLWCDIVDLEPRKKLGTQWRRRYEGLAYISRSIARFELLSLQLPSVSILHILPLTASIAQL
ncbi:hypothetical protein PTTG_25650 [Puccinia triticina 1-1 BBBD Race 1]|uniref:Uncharacterized protein n=1 Tax=Puccinia triticina (isolate 1-1 / race 1 (BBBD)) TaxID=630390 RepID=A0A180GZZ9_PUCT1|nr:hypothetical protein PTTG_25650 [Puccinia triticina 1-1 BBBD Race 1]WAR60480.1 hypothetical protein PtB15_9B419 [Puccinia triticina]